MLGVSLFTSVPEDNLDNSFGLPYAYKYWTLDDKIMFVGYDPWSRGDLMEIDETTDPCILMLQHVKKTDDSMRERIGLILPVSTNVPLSPEVDYQFEHRPGTMQILARQRVGVSSVSYSLALLVFAERCVLRGRDKTHGDEIEWKINLGNEFKLVNKLRADG